MSGLNLLGGIGQGLMAGVQFQQQKNAQDMQLRQNQARLSMLQQDQDWQRQDRDTKQAEKKRADGALAVERKWASEDLSDPEKFDAYTRELLPFASKDELNSVRQQSTALRKAVGDQAVDRFQYGGDIGGFQDALSRYSPGSILSVDKGRMKITNPDGTVQDFADVRGLTTMLKIPGAVDRIMAHEKARRDAQKDDAEIGKINATGLAALASAETSRANADKYAAEAAGQRLENEGLRLLDPKQRPGRKAGSVPAEVQTAEWLIRSGVAKDTAGAWDMVRTARGRNAEEAIASIVTKLQSDHLNATKTVPQLVSDAKQIYAEIMKPDAPAAAPAAKAPKPSEPIQVTSPEEAWRLPPGTEFITQSGVRKRVPAR
ncbi:hypothetical protein [Thauera aromatica]|uniref:hypothetical protein n=1 Tax=Thauera aromatica TaxID=59405 RepID=UPI001FFD2F12|nr:hypothetical protein [Thauera aromatica]MCK2097473.1 hypothetical protein [Thauera aromatica]